MKIVYIYSAFLTMGGADRVIIEKANYLSEHGYEVTLATQCQFGRLSVFPISPNVRLVDSGIDFGSEYHYGLFRRFFIYKRLMKRYRKVLTAFLTGTPQDIVITTLGRELDFLNSLKDGSIKIGEAHTTRDHLRSLHLLARRGLPYRLMAKWWRRKMERSVSRLDGLVLLTPEDAESWKGIVTTYVIPNSLPFYSPKPAVLNNHQAIIVGRYNDAKGYDLLTSAWKKVHERHPDWIINIYGSGEYYEQTKRLISDSGLSKVMIMHEPTAAIMDRYLESSLFVLSSRYEGFAMTLLEAMACGVPPVAFDCPYGPRNIITDGVDGLLAKYLDTDDLAEKICRLIDDATLRKAMGAHARRNILRFSKDNVMLQWTRLYESLKYGKK